MDHFITCVYFYTVETWVKPNLTRSTAYVIDQILELGANDGFKGNVIIYVSCKKSIIVEWQKVTVYIKLDCLLKSSSSNNNNDKRDSFQSVSIYTYIKPHNLARSAYSLDLTSLPSVPSSPDKPIPTSHLGDFGDVLLEC